MTASFATLPPTRPATYAEAVERFVVSSGVRSGSRRQYRISLTTWAWLFAGEQPPLGRARRGATPPQLLFAGLDNPALAQRVAEAFAARAEAIAPDTANRELSIAAGAVTWWHEQGWLRCQPTAGLRRVPAPQDRTRALSRAEIERLWRLDVDVREKTLWRLLYETAARAEEILELDVGDLDLASHRARVRSKGGAIEWVHWKSGAAQLLPRMLRGRTRGPVFITSRRARRWAPVPDVCPVTGCERLSYRRAAEIFTASTRRLDRAGDGWTLHQLRHTALTHEAEEETNTPMLLARSRHASIRSLERYCRPSVDAVARHVAQSDPAARRRRGAPVQ